MKGKFYDIAEKYLTEELMNSVPDMDDHVFSRRYLKQKEEIISSFARPEPVRAKCRPRLKYIIAAVIFACFVAITAASAYKYFNGFGLYVAPDKRSYVVFARDDIHTKDSITEHAYFSADMSEYKIKTGGFQDMSYYVSYIKDDTVIYLNQYTIENLKNLRLSVNTEMPVNPPEEIIIDGYEGMFFTTRNYSNTFFIYMNGYVISVWGSKNYSREMLEELIHSIEFKELQ